MINLGQLAVEYYIPPEIRLIRIFKCTEKSSYLWNFSLEAGQIKQTLIKLKQTSLPCSKKHITGFILSQVSGVSVLNLYIEGLLQYYTRTCF